MRSLPPAQLLYLAGKWKDGAPRDGHYVLTADIDMTGVKGFKPIASKKTRALPARSTASSTRSRAFALNMKKEICRSVRLCRQSGRPGIYQKRCSARLLCNRSAERRRSGRRKLRHDHRLCRYRRGQVPRSVQLAYRGRYLRQAEGGRRPDRRPCRGLLRQRRRFRAV